MKKYYIFIAVAFSFVLVGLTSLLSINYLNAKSVSEDFQISGNTLMKYYGTDELCVIPDGVKTIANGAFEGNEYIRRVVLPDSLEKIEYNAFAEMPLLERVVLPDSVTSIGSSSFANDEMLTAFYIGKNLSEMGTCPFAGCDGLKEVEVSEYNNCFTCIDGVLYSADRKVIYEMLPGREKNYYVFPDTVSDITPYAFWGANKLEYTQVSDAVEVVPSYAFSSANKLKCVTLSFNTKEISMKSFENCNELVQLYIPDSVEKIHETAFDGCNRLSIYAFSGSTGEEFAKNHDINIIYSPKFDLNIASTLREQSAEKKYQDNIAKNEKQEEKNSYDPDKDFDSIGSTYVANNEAVILMDPGKMEVLPKDSIKFEDGFDEILVSNLENHKVPDNLFYLKTEIKHINFPSDIEEIGKFSFARSGLTFVEIPDGVKTIGYGAFYHCADLENVVIPDSVEFIDAKAFEKTKWLENWYNSDEDDYLIVGDGILLAYKGDKSDFVLPNYVKSVSCDIE